MQESLFTWGRQPEAQGECEEADAEDRSGGCVCLIDFRIFPILCLLSYVLLFLPTTPSSTNTHTLLFLFLPEFKMPFLRETKERKEEVTDQSQDSQLHSVLRVSVNLAPSGGGERKKKESNDRRQD